MKRRAQSGLELLMFVSFSLLLFAGFYFGILKKDINAVNMQVALKAEDISERVAFEIRLAKSTGDGYTRNFTLAQDIFGSPYDVRLENDIVLIDVGESTYASHAFVSNVSGNISAGCNSISNVLGNVSVVQC